MMSSRSQNLQASCGMLSGPDTFTQFEGFLGLLVFFRGQRAVVNEQVAENFLNVLLSACYILQAIQQVFEMVELIRDAFLQFLWTIIQLFGH